MREKIAIYKIGQAIQFSKIHDPGAGAAGKIEIFRFLKLICDNNKDKDFYLMSTNDLPKCPEIQAELPNLFTFKDRSLFKYDQMYKYFKFSKCILFTGPHGAANIPNHVPLVKDPNTFAKIISMNERYVAPIANAINKTSGVKYTALLVDPRYKFSWKDIDDPSKLPTRVLSQYNEKLENHGHKYELVYSGIEKIWLYGMKQFCGDFDKAFAEKENKLVMLCNKGIPCSTKEPWKCSRYKDIIRYIGARPSDLNYIDNVEIYGVWPEELIKQDHRFHGPTTWEENYNLVKKAKCTFISPIGPGFVTSKYCEMMNGFDKTGQSLGMITFYSDIYDTQCHTIPKDSFLRVKPFNFKERLNKVFNDDEFAKSLFRWQLDNVLKPEDYTGKPISDTVMNDLNDVN